MEHKGKSKTNKQVLIDAKAILVEQGTRPIGRYREYRDGKLIKCSNCAIATAAGETMWELKKQHPNFGAVQLLAEEARKLKLKNNEDWPWGHEDEGLVCKLNNTLSYEGVLAAFDRAIAAA